MVGGGLAGVSAANTVLECGGKARGGLTAPLLQSGWRVGGWGGVGGLVGGWVVLLTSFAGGSTFSRV